MEKPSGFLEIEHTADWSLKIWAEDLPGLLQEATRGMYYLSGASPGNFQESVNISVSGTDAETLMVNYLTEIVLLGEEKGLMIEPYAPDVANCRINFSAPAFVIENQEKEIKAVTYHLLNITAVSGGLETVIVFDV